MKKNLWNKKVPTVLAFFIIAIGIGLTSYLAQTGIIPFLRAAPSETPTDIRITNINANSFTVTYKTADSVIGSINYGENKNLGQIALDDRDQKSGNPQNYKIHSITLRQLKPSTIYYFIILSGNTKFLNNNQNFILKTAPSLTITPSFAPPISGKIILPTSQSPSEALVFLKTSQSQLLSTLIKPDGIYILPINLIRTSNLTKNLEINNSTSFDIFTEDSSMNSTILWSGDTSNSIPLITLGNNYDFTSSNLPLASNSAVLIGFPRFALDQSLNATPIIESPTDNQNFSDQQPLFAGKGLPNTTINIVIHSSQIINAKITTDTQGNWIFRPSSPLSPGQHTIAITAVDQNGILKTIEKTFNIFQSGTTVAEAATPSATIAPVTQAPTQALPTLTLTPTPVYQNNVSKFPSPTISSKLLPTGNSSAIITGALGIMGSVIGIVLFLASKGASL